MQILFLPEILYIHRMSKHSDKIGGGMKETPRESKKEVRIFFSGFLEN